CSGERDDEVHGPLQPKICRPSAYLDHRGVAGRAGPGRRSSPAPPDRPGRPSRRRSRPEKPGYGNQLGIRRTTAPHVRLRHFLIFYHEPTSARITETVSRITIPS